MKITRCRINNFRSIANLEINMTGGCVVLIGINESGKSNILRALHLLDPAVSVTRNDLRLARNDEEEISTGHVDFIFELDDSELTLIEQELVGSIFPQSLSKPLIIDQASNKTFTFHECIKERREAVYEVSIPANRRRSTYWSVPAGWSVLGNWRRYNGTALIERQLVNGSIVVLNPGIIVDITDLVPDGSDNLFAEVTAKEINSLIGNKVAAQLEELPKVIFWKYSDQYMLPSSIDLSSFCSDPSSCIPLRSMFELSGIPTSKIGAMLEAAQAHSPHRFIQILKRASDAATKHIRSVWKDNRSVRIEIQPNGSALIPLVVDDEVHLDMASRSDGFKRLVSFLLQISAKARTDDLKDAVLLFDEPEIALHPGGAKSLMKELIEIGKSNSVIYSTHSIFMIDRDQIDRHLVVEKKSEVTSIWRASKSRIQDEEVLYGAIGYSIFESLKLKNIIFEGWKDKLVFSIVRDAMAKGDKSIKEFFEGVGLTFAEGVKDVKHVTKFLELASRSCLIISDADSAGLSGKKEHERSRGWGEWVTLKEVVDGNSTTIEDLMKRSSVVKRANKFRAKYPSLATLTESYFGSSENTLAGLARWLRTIGLIETDLSEALEELKDALFDGLRRDDLDDRSERLVRFVLEYNFAARAG